MNNMSQSGRMFGDRVAGKSGFSFLAANSQSLLFPHVIFSSPIAVMAHMTVQECSDRLFETRLCSNHVSLTLGIMYVMDLVLFFLDTGFLDTVERKFTNAFQNVSMPSFSRRLRWKSSTSPRYSYCRSGMRLSSRCTASIYFQSTMCKDYCTTKPMLLVVEGPCVCLPFSRISVGQDSMAIFSHLGGEAGHRISFFASSLTTTIPEPLPVDAMPTFTVLVPHYSEKILSSLREI